jgi:FkbM family methyltransferase
MENKIQLFVSNLDQAEKEVFINGEHYNEIGRQTRKKILEIASEIGIGVFAEAGACMGTDTKLLEECGWSGILIEPSEGLFEFCRQTRKCIVENYALVSKDYTSNYISEIPVFKINHILPNFPINSGNYNAISFDKLVDKHNINKIDIFVLDAEGLEQEIIKGINFEKVEITNFIIECNLNQTSRESLDTFMLSFGYSNEGVAGYMGSSFYDYHYKKIN